MSSKYEIQNEKSDIEDNKNKHTNPKVTSQQIYNPTKVTVSPKTSILNDMLIHSTRLSFVNMT